MHRASQASATRPTLTRQNKLDRLHRSDASTERKALIVGDDLRKLFALRSVLERRGRTALSADGRQAIATIDSTPAWPSS